MPKIEPWNAKRSFATFTLTAIPRFTTAGKRHGACLPKYGKQMDAATRRRHPKKWRLYRSRRFGARVGDQRRAAVWPLLHGHGAATRGGDRRFRTPKGLSGSGLNKPFSKGFVFLRKNYCRQTACPQGGRVPYVSLNRPFVLRLYGTVLPNNAILGRSLVHVFTLRCNNNNNSSTTTKVNRVDANVPKSVKSPSR